MVSPGMFLKPPSKSLLKVFARFVSLSKCWAAKSSLTSLDVAKLSAPGRFSAEFPMGKGRRTPPLRWFCTRNPKKGGFKDVNFGMEYRHVHHHLINSIYIYIYSINGAL